jgi:signal peptidase I
VLLLIGVAVLAAAWFTWLRPVGLGGSASYVVVQGASMEPTYSDGDLVLMREAPRYEHGDVIAFRAGGTFDDPARIIHRIVGDAGDGRFVTQGDNHERTDPWQPGPDEIIGRADLRVPAGGDVAKTLTRPVVLAGLGAAAVFAGRRLRCRRRRVNPISSETAVESIDPQSRLHPRKPPREDPVVSYRWARLTRPRWAFVGLVVFLVLALPVLGMTWSALRSPDSTQRLEPIGAVDHGIDLDYSFRGPASVVYPDGAVGTTSGADGEVIPDGPLYSRLLDTLVVEVALWANAAGADRVESTYAIDVAVEAPGGWSTQLDSVEPQPIDGATTERFEIDLRDVANRVAWVTTLTGVGGGTHTISVTPRLDVRGIAGAEVIDQTLTAPATFTAEGNLITAEASEASERRELTRPVSESARYGIGPLSLETQTARGLFSGLALVLVAGIAWFSSVLFAGVGLDEPDRIAARYRSQIVDVAATAAPPGPVVMVRAFDELARIARVEQTVVLREELGYGSHRYRVFVGNVTYEYEVAPAHPGGATTPLAEDVATDEGPGG